MTQYQRTETLIKSWVEGEIDLINMLSPGKVTVFLSKEIAKKPQAQLMFSFIVNLISRQYPVAQSIDVILPFGLESSANQPRWKHPQLTEHIRIMLTDISSKIIWNIRPKIDNSEGTGIILGDCPQIFDKNIYIGSDGWELYLSPNSPQIVGDKVNPIGAYSAACFAVAEFWKSSLYRFKDLFPNITISPINETLKFSTFNYQIISTQNNPEIPETINLKNLTTIGLGAGGGAAIYTLASAKDLNGEVILIEPDEITESNLNRYIFADFKDAKSKVKKSSLMETILSKFKNLNVIQYPFAFDEIKEMLSIHQFENVFSAVHSREARRNIQYYLPKILWDAGATEHGDFKIWRLEFNKTECMHCKHPLNAEDLEIKSAKQYSNQFSKNIDWLGKIRDNNLFTLDEIHILKTILKNNKDLDFELPSLGERFSDWEANQCGKINFEKSDGEIPIPFAPVLAGVLIAGEIIKQQYFPNSVLNSYYYNSVLGNFMKNGKPELRRPSLKCYICNDEDYSNTYNQKWGIHHPLPL